ncbi:MAG: Rnase Y domain-containing protein, partial [Gemmatimonadaceae bacterium]|nr:Rnase Y domain-containing protein [Gemmatimonadaceae bacterium]
MTETAWIAAVGSGIIALASAVFFFVGRRAGTKSELARQLQAKSTAEETAKRVLDEAARESESLRKSAVLSGKEELIRLREDWELEARKRREEIEAEEHRVQERETVLNRKYDLLEQREKEASARTADVGRRQEALSSREQELDRLLADERRRLEQLAGLSAQEAKAELVQRLVDEAQADAANRIRDIRETARRNADREAKKIIALAIQRIAAEQTAETTVSAVALPNDEMKGRIIGREGRNIRALESATGVDLIIDDTPDAVTLSAFDPVRR